MGVKNRTFKRCPITGKRPEACTYPGFRESCAAFRVIFLLKTGNRFKPMNLRHPQ